MLTRRHSLLAFDSHVEWVRSDATISLLMRKYGTFVILLPYSWKLCMKESTRAGTIFWNQWQYARKPPSSFVCGLITFISVHS